MSKNLTFIQLHAQLHTSYYYLTSTLVFIMQGAVKQHSKTPQKLVVALPPDVNGKSQKNGYSSPQDILSHLSGTKLTSRHIRRESKYITTKGKLHDLAAELGIPRCEIETVLTNNNQDIHEASSTLLHDWVNNEICNDEAWSKLYNALNQVLPKCDLIELFHDVHL